MPSSIVRIYFHLHIVISLSRIPCQLYYSFECNRNGFSSVAHNQCSAHCNWNPLCKCKQFHSAYFLPLCEPWMALWILQCDAVVSFCYSSMKFQSLNWYCIWWCLEVYCFSFLFCHCLGWNMQTICKWYRFIFEIYLFSWMWMSCGMLWCSVEIEKSEANKLDDIASVWRHKSHFNVKKNARLRCLLFLSIRSVFFSRWIDRVLMKGGKGEYALDICMIKYLSSCRAKQ